MASRGAIDIGTNSVRLLIVDEGGVERARAMRITRLGQGVAVHGALDAGAIARTLAVLADYAAVLRREDVARLRVTATSAARDADNRGAFFDAVEDTLGARPELLSGEEEALLSFRGATAGLATELGPFLVFDIGGGSTELVLGQAGPEAALSLDMGCVRMTERHLHHDPPTADEIAACVADVERGLVRARDEIDVARAREAIGLAGTVTTLAALELGLDHYDASRTHHLRLSRVQVDVQVARLQAADLAGRRRMLAEPGRADVIVGGALVLSTLLRVLDVSTFLVSETDILDGLVMSLADAAR